MESVLLIGDSPSLNTGFGKILDILVDCIIDEGLKPIVFSLKQSNNKYKKCEVHYDLINRQNVFEDLLKKHNPKFILSLADTWDLAFIAEAKKKYSVNWIAYTPVESTPFCRYSIIGTKQIDLGKILSYANKIITYSDFGLDAIKKMFIEEVGLKRPESAFKRIYLGIDTNLFRPIEKQEARKVLPGLKEDDILFLCTKVDSARVGYDLLLRAWEKAYKELKYVRPAIQKKVKLYLHTPLNMIGGTDIPNLLRLLDVESSVMINPSLKFGSGVDEETLVSIMNSADVFVSCAKGEGFGLPIVEAMAVGIPCILPNYGCPTEFESDGLYFVDIAEYYNPNFSYTNFGLVDTEKFASQIVQLACSFSERTKHQKTLLQKSKEFDISFFIDAWKKEISSAKRMSNLKSLVYSEVKTNTGKTIEVESV